MSGLDFFESQEIAGIEGLGNLGEIKIQEAQEGVRGKVERRTAIRNRIKRNVIMKGDKEISEVVLDIINNGKSFTLKQLNAMFGPRYMPGMSIYDYMENLVATCSGISARGWKKDREYYGEK